MTAQFNQSRVESKYIIKHSHSSHAMSPSLYDKAPEMLIVIAYAQEPHLNTHAVVSMEAKGLNFCPSIHLLPYFVYANSEGSGAESPRSLRCSHMRLVSKFRVLAL